MNENYTRHRRQDRTTHTQARHTLLSWLCVAAALAQCAVSSYATAPTVITQLASNATASSFYMRGVVNPNGTNTFARFEFGTTSSLGTTLSNQNVGSGSTNVYFNGLVTGLEAGTRYYYRAIATNVTGATTGAVENAVTTQVSYSPTGTECTMDILRPYGSEPGSVWDDVARQTRYFLDTFIRTEHNCDGTHQDNFLKSSYIQDGAVTLSKLSSSVQGSLTNFPTNAVIQATVTNALTYVGSIETNNASNSTAHQTQSASLVGLATVNVSTNVHFRFLLVTTDTVFGNTSSGNRKFNIYLAVNNVLVPSAFVQNVLVTPQQNFQFITPSWLVAATNVTTIAVYASSDNSGLVNGVSAQTYNLRVFGIP